jgi:hypothetical protein
LILPQLLKISCLTQSALLSKKRKNTYINCLETKFLLQSYYTVDQEMGGIIKTSTHVVTTKVQLSPYLRSKMGTASAASPKLSGHLTTRMLLIQLPYSLTSHSKGASHTRNKRSMQLGVTVTGDLGLLEVMNMSYVHVMNHSMVMISAYHMQIILVIRSPCKTGRTC